MSLCRQGTCLLGASYGDESRRGCNGSIHVVLFRKTSLWEANEGEGIESVNTVLELLGIGSYQPGQ